MFVKYCGFTRFEDLEYAASLPLSAVGFIFHPPSKRYVSPGQASELAAILKETNILKAGVFVHQSAEEIKEIALQVGLDMLQIYDHSLVADLSSFRPLLISYRVKDSTLPEDIVQPQPPNLILLDAYQPEEHGGTGKTFNWGFLDQILSIQRTIIAGGITPVNVMELLTHCQPYGIDISSGIEIAPGIKDRRKMEMIIRKVSSLKGC